MSRDREIAEAFSEGLNCIAGIVTALRENASPPKLPQPQWEEALWAMENALEAIASKEVQTSLAVPQEQRESVRRLHVLIGEWTKLGMPPPGLQETAQKILVLFDLGDP